MPYTLDAHGEQLLQQYREHRHIFQRIEEIAVNKLNEVLAEQGILITAIEHRIKEEKSFAGKLERKGQKYASCDDITDIFGMRIITFYNDDVDKVAAIVKRLFKVDWDNSIDKRKLHQLTSFGYNSLHYICSIPKKLAEDPAMPELNKYRFEIQMRTALQHVWSTLEHDTGYKGDVKIPDEYRRQFSRLAGMLELVDEEFSRLRINLAEYRRKVLSLTASGRLDEVPLDRVSFKKYLETEPFKHLNERIAATNQAEIIAAPLRPFLPVFEYLELKTLGDVHRFIHENEENAFQLAISQLAFTDLDIVSENVGPTNLCLVAALKKGLGREGIIHIYDLLNGTRQDNALLADIIIQQAESSSFSKIS